MAQSLEDQLAEVFARGLDSDPDLRASLEEALSSSSGNGKCTKAEADYRKADSETDRCGNCTYFQDPDRCVMVSGTIRPADVCDLFDLKEDGAEDSGNGVES